MDNYGPCDPTTGIKTRGILNPAVNGGTCTDIKTAPCPVNCVMGDWGVCDPTTGTKTRGVLTPLKNGGTCTDPTSTTCPVNCVLSKYSNYSNCYLGTDGKTYKRRQSNIVTPPLNNGTPCSMTVEGTSTAPAVPGIPTLSTNGKCGTSNNNTVCPGNQCCSYNGGCGTDFNSCLNRAVAFSGPDSYKSVISSQAAQETVCYNACYPKPTQPSGPVRDGQMAIYNSCVAGTDEGQCTGFGY